MYSSAGSGPARRGGNPPVNVAPPQIRGPPNPPNMPPMANAAGAGSSRISDMLDQVKAEYEAAIQQLNISKMEQLEMERKIQSQVVEMDQIQQTLKTLEANHRRIRQQYEEDMMRMRRQLEGQAAPGVKISSNKRIRTQSSSGSGAPMQPEDGLMSVVNVATGGASNRSSNPRSNSPVRVVPVQPASRSLQQLGQQPITQGQPPQSQQQPQQPPPQLSPLEGQSTTPTNRRGPIPGLNREGSQEANGKVDGRSIPPVSQSGPSSPVSKKSKSNGSGESNSIPSLSNGKGALPSVSASTGSASSGALIPSVPKIHREHHASAESSPSSSSNNSGQTQAVPASTPTTSSTSAAGKQSPPESNQAANSSGASGSNATQKTSNSKASRLNWSCVYSSKSTMAYQESERPVAEMHQSMDHQSVVCVVRFSNDGTMMASGCHKTAQVFDVKTGDRKFFVSRPGSNGGNANNAAAATNEADDAYVRAVCFSPDCTKLVAGMPHNTIRIWDIASNEEGPAMTGHESEIYSLDYVNDFIVSGSGDRKVRLWDARSGQCKKIFGSETGGPSDGVTSVALSPDGRLLAAGSLDKVVRIWDTETAQLLDRLEGHSDSVYSIAFSPDGKNLISGSLDRNIMLWDVCAQGRTTTRPRMLFQGHKDFVLSVAYTPDGRYVVLALGVCW
ncbi:Transcriptional repressor tup1-like protein, partial [Globisporangium splendens]